jgi:predicted phosphoribosyltransferase
MRDKDTTRLRAEWVSRARGEEREQRELQRREREYRDGRASVDIRDRTVILVDDGLATGSSMRVAAIALKKKRASGNHNCSAGGSSPDLC